MTKFYGKTKSEEEATSTAVNRQIVAEIMNFGVKEDQILHIIKLLALELEDRTRLVTICDCVNELIENSDNILEEGSGLIRG